MTPRRDLLLYLSDLGWSDVGLQPRAPAASERPDDVAAGTTHVAVNDAIDPLGASDLASMAELLAGCRRCRLCEGRTQVVFGVGSANARLVFVGEGPGADEDRLGEPFVGRAGRLLTAMLRAIGLARDDVYIANVVKCRPPRNRDPENEEVGSCLPFLCRQIELISPEVVVTLGRVAARHLVGMQAPISSYRGRWLEWKGRRVLPTFHPAYLLRNPAAKAQAWSDLKRVRESLRIEK